ncbi:MAG: heavy-metal-associated domain-containing protein [Verrucomicrobia bacterium]|nr:heavy-metal-associated domain-containing protein [Verrucomicrobiota bacterium]MDA1085929.1 heavy-metal-associated domain-containing protein [Verrucomicrobiota bacterium]
MKLWIHGFVALLLIAGMVSCRKERPRVVTVLVPGLNGEKCAQIISESLARADGIRMNTLEFDYEKREITLEYDSMRTAVKNVEHFIAKAGFDANTVPAYKEGLERLPEECK